MLLFFCCKQVLLVYALLCVSGCDCVVLLCLSCLFCVVVVLVCVGVVAVVCVFGCVCD